MINQKVNSLLSRLNLWNNLPKETVQERLWEGPVFIGSKKEFKRYVGPVLRNLVQQITRKHRQEIGHCQHCREKENLQSAHVAGRNRNHIIDDLLTDFQKGDFFEVNLKDFEKRFKEEHEPLEKSILILCKSCHLKYDSMPVEKSIPLSTPKVKIDKEPVVIATTTSPTPPTKKVFTAEKTSGRKLETKAAIFTSREFSEFKHMKIGKLVKATLPKLIKLQRIGNTEFLKLQDP
ncbi:MAG TPA: hypothetical protein ENO10_05380, partial [Salinimicrobium catena]|nr:hypothetical protein [Salinimicrobium catena]